MNVVLTMSSFIFPLVTFPYVSRVLLPEGTGKVSFAISVITYFTMFAQLVFLHTEFVPVRRSGMTRKNFPGQCRSF